jgi:alpha-L-rhamnosidase
MNPHPPGRPRCEYLDNPIGLATAAPRFSWLPEHPRRGARQAAYQVIVSPERDFLQKGVGDYWDSQRVESERTSGVAYEGAPLWSGKRYFWRVRWWDEEGKPSLWSETAWFEMGLLQERDWKARWISRRMPDEFTSRGTVMQGEYSGDFVQTKAIYLRKEFESGGALRRARAYICGLGCYELRLNGQKVGDRVLDPAQTDYRKIALYSVYDIMPHLQTKNALAVILGNGRHIKNYGYGKPRLLVQIHLEREDELVERISSDGTWKANSGPLLENGLYSGERYDARLEWEGWDAPGFDDSSWEEAEVVSGPSVAPQALPPIRVVETLRPVKVWSPRPDVHVFDFDQNFSGWVRLKTRGPRGREIRLRHAELVGEDGTLNVLPNQNAEATDIFILKGQGEEVYEPRFTYHGFRYAEVEGLPGEPEEDSLVGCFVHSDVERTGEFRCSHPLLNRVHQNIIWGQLSNLMSIPTDCPQRDERHGWLGDAHLSAEESILNFDMSSFFSKFMEDIRLSQKEDGSLPDTVPPFIQRLYPADPAWGIAYLELAWLMFLYFDDERVLQRHYSGMKRYVDHLSKHAEDHIIQKLGKYGDWCPPGSVVPKKTPLELTSTWCYYRAAVLLSAFARVLSRTDDERDYARLAEAIKSAFNARFLVGDQYAAFRVGPADKSPDQSSNVLPLALDMVPEEKRGRVLARLIDSVVKEWDYHLDTGIMGTRYLLDVLTDNGHGETAFRVATQRSYPGWGFMVESGATTLWERWENLTGAGMNSHNHIMFGSIDAWLYRAVAGLRCVAPGWRKMVIRPLFCDGLDEASAKVVTVRGPAEVAWKKEEHRFDLTARIPVGAEAEVHIPRRSGRGQVKESGAVIWRDGQVSEVPAEISGPKEVGPYLVFTVGSGRYSFRSESATVL